MSEKAKQPFQSLMAVIRRRLRWRVVGLVSAVAVLFFIVSAMGVGGSNGPANDPPIYARLRNLSQLTTIEMKLSTVVKIVNGRTIVKGIDEVLIYGVCGRVTAGIRLSELEEADVDADIGKRSIRLRLPPAEIFSITRTLENDMRDVPRYQLEGKERWVEMRSPCEHEYKWDVPPFMPRTMSLISLARGEALKAFARTAEESGIREMAQVEAEEQLERLLRLAGYEIIEFEIKQDIQPGQE